MHSPSDCLVKYIIGCGYIFVKPNSQKYGF
nr:MAG TPA: Protein trafficking PGA2 [Caudoviricetes sp.]